jgi:hypothetical protein
MIRPPCLHPRVTSPSESAGSHRRAAFGSEPELSSALLLVGIGLPSFALVGEGHARGTAPAGGTAWVSPTSAAGAIRGWE